MWQNVTIEPWQAVMGLRGARSQFVVALNNARVLGRVTRKTLLLRLGGVGRMLGDVSEHLIALSLLIICVIVKSMILYVSASKQGSCITLSMESSTHKYVELSHGTDLDIISDLCNWSTSPAFVKVITTIRTWKRDLGRLKINMAADRDAKPPTLTDMPSSAMLTDMSSSAIVAAAGDASGADLPMICSINFHNSEAVNKALHWLLDKRAYTENNTHAVAEAWIAMWCGQLPLQRTRASRVRVEHEQDTANAKLHKYILKVISGNTTWWCGSLLARTDDRRTGGDTGGVDGCRHTVLRRAFVELDRVHERVGKIFRVTHYKYAFLCGISIICVYM